MGSPRDILSDFNSFLVFKFNSILFLTEIAFVHIIYSDLFPPPTLPKFSLLTNPPKSTSSPLSLIEQNLNNNNSYYYYLKKKRKKIWLKNHIQAFSHPHSHKEKKTPQRHI